MTDSPSFWGTACTSRRSSLCLEVKASRSEDEAEPRRTRSLLRSSGSKCGEGAVPAENASKGRFRRSLGPLSGLDLRRCGDNGTQSEKKGSNNHGGEKGSNNHGGAADRKEQQNPCRAGSGHVSQADHARESTQSPPRAARQRRLTGRRVCQPALTPRPGRKSVNAHQFQSNSCTLAFGELGHAPAAQRRQSFA
jgi:hypothetical protein